MKKIIISIILILFLFSGVFIITKNKKSDKKTLTFWTIQLKPIYEKQLNKIIADFEANHPDIKVVWVDIPIGEAQKRTLASVLSSTPPDIVNLNPDFSLLLAQRNALEFFSKEEAKDYQESLVDKLKYKGKIYALPFYATSSITVYNKEIYNKCLKNKDFIKTYDELYSTAKNLQGCSNTPLFASNLNENDTLAKILNKYNISTLQSEAEKQKALELFRMFNEMYKQNYMPKDVLSSNHREIVEKYMSNQALIIVAGANFVNMIKQNAPDIYSKSEISNQLTSPGGAYDIALMNLIIPKKAKNKLLAKEFISSLTNKDNQLELSKLTNVLSANKYALQDDFFKNCSSDLVDKSRCISALQLNKLNNVTFGENNKKTLNETINKTFEEILLNNNSDENFIKEKINSLSSEIKTLQSN